MASPSLVELYAAICRDTREGMSGREVQRKHGVGWHTVQAALAPAWPVQRAPYPARASKLDLYKPIIDGILVADLDAARKQHHTVTWIFDRLCSEHGMTDVSSSAAGPRHSPTRDSAPPSLTASPSAATSSKPAAIPTASRTRCATEQLAPRNNTDIREHDCPQYRTDTKIHEQTTSTITIKTRRGWHGSKPFEDWRSCRDGSEHLRARLRSGECRAATGAADRVHVSKTDLVNRLVQARIPYTLGNRGAADPGSVDIQFPSDESQAANEVVARQAFAYGGGLSLIKSEPDLVMVWPHFNLVAPGGKSMPEPCSPSSSPRARPN